jgi:hypothetical protein
MATSEVPWHDAARVSNERLTRQELSWLLAQEARGAAKALRDGVTQLKAPAIEIDSVPDVATNLDALDDAIERLTQLQSGSQGKARRGRIDLAALLYEVAPNARIAIEPGAGTEVFGEEGELRRMLHVLVSQTNTDPTSAAASSPAITIRRQDEWVKITVELGPDSSATAELERRWLSRMAVRHGGRLELEGGTESVLLPADGASDQREVVELRKELEQAQQLGEAYARELATMLAQGDAPPSEFPPPLSEGGERFEALLSGTAALARPLRSLLEGIKTDCAELGQSLGENHPLSQALSRRVTAGMELLAEMERVAQCPRNEPDRELDLAELVREAVSASDTRAARHGVTLALEGGGEPIPLHKPKSGMVLLLRALVDHAISATPRDSRVVVRLDGARLTVEDGGPVVPLASRRHVSRRLVDPAALGRPGGPALLVADAAAAAFGVELGLGETENGRSAVIVRF